ncbi:MAG: YjbH domain-containing protein [Candidatus Marinimicrobia bacterium]|jgi:hypothetical protein|nr:YjbH domain-containing protein [Candidatus Neomarinimicrobiota bacterium]MDP7061067.1 YjbH domain-containing protein [Candidatus Neomarinimicrobiota bacterium]|tara:strand:- start:4043 stop:4804 length:762 start_codon:yes stop_codon:yes gene_type:complete
MRLTSAAFLSILVCLSAQEYPPPTSLVTIPTAGGLVRGAFSADMRMQRNGGLTTSLAVGLSDRFMFGLSYGASNLIGDDEPVPYPRPEVILKYRLIDEGVAFPGIAFGIDTQGFGNYIDADSLNRYEIKGYGAYLTASKNWRTLLGNLGLHLGANYNFTENVDEDDDLNLFAGFDFEFNPEFSFLMEYNAALNQNDMTAETLALSKGGYLNAGLRWSLFQNLHLDLHFNNLLFDEEKVSYFNREIKVTYIEYF